MIDAESDSADDLKRDVEFRLPEALYRKLNRVVREVNEQDDAFESTTIPREIIARLEASFKAPVETVPVKQASRFPTMAEVLANHTVLAEEEELVTKARARIAKELASDPDWLYSRPKSHRYALTKHEDVTPPFEPVHIPYTFTLEGWATAWVILTLQSELRQVGWELRIHVVHIDESVEERDPRMNYHLRRGEDGSTVGFFHRRYVTNFRLAPL